VSEKGRKKEGPHISTFESINPKKGEKRRSYLSTPIASGGGRPGPCCRLDFVWGETARKRKEEAPEVLDKRVRARPSGPSPFVQGGSKGKRGGKAISLSLW